MMIPEMEFSDNDLNALDEIRAKAEASRMAQAPKRHSEMPIAMPEFGDEELDIPELS